MSNEKPTIYDDVADIHHLNELLDKATDKPITSPSLAVNIIRACLELYGIVLPVLEVESQPTGADMQAALTQMHMGKQPVHSPVECEYTFKLLDDDAQEPVADDNDWDDNLYLYICIDRHDETGYYEAYAQVVDKKDLDDLINMDMPELEKEFPEYFYGAQDGEDKYQTQVRHVGPDEKTDLGG